MRVTKLTCVGIMIASLVALSGPARASVTYTFTSSQGDFVFTSADYFSNGPIDLSELTSYDFTDTSVDSVFFHNATFSTISLLTPTCEQGHNCFTATFGQGNIFATDGTYPDLDDADTQLVISGQPDSIPAPEPATVALFGVGLLGLGYIRRRKGV